MLDDTVLSKILYCYMDSINKRIKYMLLPNIILVIEQQRNY